ncbi:hypothetical protein [Ornithinibacillus bavariensis]|uniref:hypothetical protein n=1 Tax=Ornithinibacillus bavariensis TaxID=545502 RepID=UPI003D249BD1
MAIKPVAKTKYTDKDFLGNIRYIMERHPIIVIIGYKTVKVQLVKIIYNIYKIAKLIISVSLPRFYIKT